MKKLLSAAAAAFFISTANACAAPMTLNVHEADLRSTIIMVARAAALNVSVDDSVTGTISMSINGTEPAKILEIIAKTKNLSMIRDGEIFIMTSHVNNGALMKSYVLPVRYGDPENLRKAVVLSLDPDLEVIPDHFTRLRNNDGSYTYRYSFRDSDSDSGRNTTQEKIKREDRVLVSPDVNALVLFGTEAEYERARNLLAGLDVELKQVSVEAKILVIDKSASKNLGIDWYWSSIPQNSSTRRENMDKANAYGLVQFGRAFDGVRNEFYFSAEINALISNGKAKILSRPNVTTVQGREAVIYVGNEVPVEKSQTIDSTTTSSYEYKDAGIKLRYTPRVNVDGTITAKLYTEVSTPDYDKNTGAYRFNTRTAETTVTVRDGEPMIIGGLIGAEEAKSISKIPFLGDLPLLGALFRSHRKSKSESELMIFITAHVLKGAAR